jgi:hypothetical protein
MKPGLRKIINQYMDIVKGVIEYNLNLNPYKGVKINIM